MPKLATEFKATTPSTIEAMEFRPLDRKHFNYVTVKPSLLYRLIAALTDLRLV